MSQFTFLQPEFPEVHDAAHRAEALANSDPRASCFYARRALELAIVWAFEHDATLKLPYRDDLSALIHEPTFRTVAGQAVYYKCRAIKDLGNQAVHSAKPLTRDDATAAVRELFHVAYWLVRTYAQGAKPSADLAFDPNALPITATIPKQTLAQLQQLHAQLAQERERLFSALAEKESLDEELKRLRAEVAAAKRANEATPDTHNYTEAATRDLFIDLLLREAGWPLDQPADREYEVAGMPNAEGRGFVDYVLWGRDGKPLAVVEAKRTRRDARAGQHQAKLYADCLEEKFGQRPIIFYTNGYEHWIWDDKRYPPRPVQGFYTREELELLIQRRYTQKPLATVRIDERIVERYYQTRAIRRVGEAFDKDHARRALLVMATGSGKTRTVIALVDQLMRANWAKRVLFLADRTALVNQAVNAFKRHLPEASPVNLVTEKQMEGRVYVSTYPTMIGLIDESRGDQKRFGPGYFDLVIIDEAHRSVFMKYRAIFDYFDSYLVGLTATPKEDVGRNTYALFELEDGVPTDAYTLQEAVDDGFLVPPKGISVPLKFPTQGLTYAELSDEDKEEFELTDWKEREDDVRQTGRIEAAAFNQWLFNADTVDKALRHLMEHGLKVDGGDKLGKTIIFAKNHDHAVFIADRFNAHYPRDAGHFAQVIDFKVDYAQNLIDRFSDPSKLPQIAISVDMLDTGIDVPEVVNLVFFKQVRSKTKFWQMIGRGTRLCPDLFGPGKDKESFTVFDFCGNLEFFSQNLEQADSSSGASLSQRLFVARLKLIRAISGTKEGAKLVREHLAGYGSAPLTDEEVLKSIVELLQAEVGAMNTDNFIVRAKRKLVEKYQQADAWTDLDDESLSELEHDIAGLPSERMPESVEAKQFDLLMLRLQLVRLQQGQGFGKLKQAVQQIAASLEESSNIPMIKEQLGLIEDLQTDGWWEDVTVPMLEGVRLRLRNLVPLIEQRRGNVVLTNITDEIGEGEVIDIVGEAAEVSLERFREKARAFLQNYLDREAIVKLRMAEPIAHRDLEELEAILRELGANAGILDQVRDLGLVAFVRSLVGLDARAARRALGPFAAQGEFNSSQQAFVELIVTWLTEHGELSPYKLYEWPFTDIHSAGPEGLFDEGAVEQLLAQIEQLAVSGS